MLKIRSIKVAQIFILIVLIALPLTVCSCSPHPKTVEQALDVYDFELALRLADDKFWDEDKYEARRKVYGLWITYLINNEEYELAGEIAREQGLTSHYNSVISQIYRDKIMRNYAENSKLPTKHELALVEKFDRTLFVFFMGQGQYDTARQIVMMESYSLYRDSYLREVDEAQGIKPRKK